MVNSADDYRAMATNTADERQHQRISAFKNKVATLRATSKVYNIVSIEDRSINTLDSSIAGSSTVASSISSRSAKGVARDAAKSVADSKAVVQGLMEKRSPEETQDPFADQALSRYQDETPVAGCSAAAGGYRKNTPDPMFYSDDSELSGSQDDGSRMSNLLFSGTTESDADSDSLKDMFNAFQKQTRTNPTTLTQETSSELNNKIATPPVRIKAKKIASGTIRTSSYTSDQSSASKTSSNSFSTDGFSVQSLHEESDTSDVSNASIVAKAQLKERHTSVLLQPPESQPPFHGETKMNPFADNNSEYGSQSSVSLLSKASSKTKDLMQDLNIKKDNASSPLLGSSNEKLIPPLGNAKTNPFADSDSDASIQESDASTTEEHPSQTHTSVTKKNPFADSDSEASIQKSESSPTFKLSPKANKLLKKMEALNSKEEDLLKPYLGSSKDARLGDKSFCYSADLSPINAAADTEKQYAVNNSTTAVVDGVNKNSETGAVDRISGDSLIGTRLSSKDDDASLRCSTDSLPINNAADTEKEYAVNNTTTAVVDTVIKKGEIGAVYRLRQQFEKQESSQPAQPSGKKKKNKKNPFAAAASKTKDLIKKRQTLNNKHKNNSIADMQAVSSMDTNENPFMDNPKNVPPLSGMLEKNPFIDRESEASIEKPLSSGKSEKEHFVDSDSKSETSASTTASKTKDLIQQRQAFNSSKKNQIANVHVNQSSGLTFKDTTDNPSADRNAKDKPYGSDNTKYNPFADCDSEASISKSDSSATLKLSAKTKELLKKMEVLNRRNQDLFVGVPEVTLKNPFVEVCSKSGIQDTESSCAASNELVFSRREELIQKSQTYILEQVESLVAPTSIEDNKDQETKPTQQQPTKTPKNPSVDLSSINDSTTGYISKKYVSPSTTSTNPFAEGLDYVDSVASSTITEEDDQATPPRRGKSSSDNPFADLLRLRRSRESAMHRHISRRVGSMTDLDSSSNADTSMSSSATMQASQSTTEASNTTKVISFGSVDNQESLDGLLFSDLKQQLSKIQSVEYEDSFEEANGDDEEERVFLACSLKVKEELKLEETEIEEEDEDMSRPADMKSHVIVKEETPSCAISSLDFSALKVHSGANNNNCFDIDSTNNDEPFEDDDDDGEVRSFPRSPAPLMSRESADIHQVHLLGQGSYGNDSEQEEGTASEKTKQVQESNAVAESGDIATAPCSNSHKADNFKYSEVTALSPPKDQLVIRDGSISTKDSILGTTIDVSNSNLVVERIYLESLRAQVLAELKVHVADEEIRLALDARLRAIQDYYKRKATVCSLGKVAPSGNTTRAESIYVLGDLPKVKPTVVHANAVGQEPGNPGTPAPDVITYPQQQDNVHKFAYERVQSQIDEAIKSAHNSPKGSRSAKFPSRHDNADVAPPHDEEEKVPEDREDEALYNCQSTETPIPLHIFTKDTFWDDEDDPSTMNFSPSALEGASPGIEMDLPPTHVETIHNAWNHYSNINTLIFDCRIYDSEFSNIQHDPLYPYLNSLLGISDGGEDGYSAEHKRISQKVKRGYAAMSPHRICHTLARDAEEALPELKAICAFIGNKLGMQTMAIGPMKRPSDALLKCEKKYGGDPLLVTDYCRASLFVKDIASLLALIEIVLSKYARIVCRIKLSPLKSDHDPLIGGYRDCKINLEIGGHVCEIQVHLISMWLLREGSGYSHYKECCEQHVDTSQLDIGITLSGLERVTLADLIKTGEHVTNTIPLVSLKQYNESQIRDYFALANMYLHYGQPAKAEVILRRTVKLRSESRNFGPCHDETMLHLELLRMSLKCQHKYKSASSVKNQMKKMRRMQHKGRDRNEDDKQPRLSQLCKSDQCGAMDFMCDVVFDPARKDRMEEKQKLDAVEESRALWLTLRRSFFT